MTQFTNAESGQSSSRAAASELHSALMSGQAQSIAGPVLIDFEYANFVREGHELDPNIDAIYRVNNDPAYALVIDGKTTGTITYDDGLNAVYAGSFAPEDKLSFYFQSGLVFTPTAISVANFDNYLDYADQNQTLEIRGFNGNQQVGLTRTYFLADGNPNYLPETISLTGMTGITRLEVTATSQGGQIQYLQIDSLTMSDIHMPPPQVISVSTPTTSGSYPAGTVIEIKVQFDRAITVDTSGGAPVLQLETGATDREAVFHSASANTLTFRYTVQAGDTSADLAYKASSSLLLNGAQIRALDDGANVNAALPQPGTLTALDGIKNIVIDTTAPTLTISSSKDDLKAGETATISFTFSETPAGFTHDDIVVSGGTLGPLSGAGPVLTAVFTPLPNRDGGSASISVAAGDYADAAGNSGGAGAPLSLNYDTKAPTVAIVSDRSSFKAGETALITFIFSEDPGAAFTAADIVVSGGSLGALDGSGLTRSAVFTPTANTNGGAASITVSAGAYLDDAGNQSVAGITPALSFDTRAPAAPSAPDLVSASDSGNSDSDNVTGDTTPTFSGTAEAGATVTLYDGASVVGTATATGSAWSITSSALAHGDHTLVAVAQDAAGNQSVASAGLTVTIDTSAPDNAAVSLAFSSDSGASATDLVTNAAAQTISGELDAGLAAGERVEISIDGGASWHDATASTGSKAWSYAATLAPGANTVQVRVANAVDNTGPLLSRGYVLDTVAPTLTIASDQATLKAGQTATITFSFSEDPGASFAWDGSSGDLVVSGGTLGALSGAGTVRTAVFTPNPGVDAGSASITLAAGAWQDLAGNGGGAGSLTLAYDTLAPSVPSAPALDSASDSGLHGDGITKDSTPTLGGTAQAGATVLLFDAGGHQVGSGSADGAGAWTISLGALADGVHAFTARTRDAAGNLSAPSAAAGITVDTAAPTLAITSSAAQLRAGQSAVITFSFSEDPGAGFTAADIVVSGGTLGPLGGSGTVRSATFTPTAGVDAGLASITVAAGSYQDAAGNNGGAGATPVLQFDTLAPSAPPAPRLAPESDSGAPGDGLTNREDPLIVGDAAPNSVVRLYDGTALVGSATADGSGSWSIATSLGDGNHVLRATQLDAAGNESATGAAFNLRIDAPSAPSAPLVDGVPVTVRPVVLPGGVQGSAVSIPVVTGSRTETSGNVEVADIPLATAGGSPVLLAQLPAGFGLSASGANVQARDALALLLASIRAATPGHAPQDQGHLTGNGQDFLAGLGADNALLVQTLRPVSNAAPAGSLTLSGPSAAPGQQVALVIDTARMAGGGVIELREVGFAAVIGSAQVVAASGDTILSGDGASQQFTIQPGGAGAVFAGGGDDILGFGAAPVPAAQQRALSASETAAMTTLHGGQGNDTASFAGAYDEYSVEWHKGYVVVASKAAPEQRALVVNAEQLKFADAAIAIEQAPGLDALAGMYAAVLDRQADLYGFEYWAQAHEAGMSWGAIAVELVGSSEHAASHGGFNGQSGHDLALLYAALFGRQADAGGLAYWQAVLAQGTSLEQVATAFVESAEMIGQRIAAPDWDFIV
ncbi:hypothetical protein B0920_15765 [Massilia sp. KIM]|uniref:Ig-like domain-containing protein n=1 Tax=Massilia sp. KIM TaxID=1955422 RepID=UPI0009900312|nr:Ig-like domain-containing protein [Massilia sp. KIM]OON60443.1 hypothetical protein B0920_15765 [Massilia sp. KIM]